MRSSRRRRWCRGTSVKPAFLERLALELRGKDLGDGLVHRVAHAVAREITWNAGRMAVEI